MKQYKLSSTMRAAMLLAVLAMLAACQKPFLDETTGGEVPTEANVVLRFTQFEWTEQREPFELARKWPSRDVQRRSQQESFTRAATNITALCSRLNIAIFDGDGTKVKTIAQKEGDASYGTVALSLAAGTYKLVVMAHNCDGSATITSTEKVTRYTGSFFGDGGGGSTGSGDFRMTADPDWDSVNGYTF